MQYMSLVKHTDAASEGIIAPVLVNDMGKWTTIIQ